MKWTCIAGHCWLAAAAGVAGAAMAAAPCAHELARAAAPAVVAAALPAREPETTRAQPAGPAPGAASVWAQHQVPVARLADARAGDDTNNVDNSANVHGAVASNTASNVATGSNSISAGSFANAVGLPVVIQNSGANVLIQNSTIINLQLR